MTFQDQDKGGQPGFVMDKVNMGPTVGQVYKPRQSERMVISGVSYTVLPWDNMILLALAPVGVFNFLLPDIVLWMKFPYGQQPLLFKLMNDNGGNAVTFTPFGTQTIDGLASVQVLPTLGMAPFPSLTVRPRVDLSGWLVT